MEVPTENVIPEDRSRRLFRELLLGIEYCKLARFLPFARKYLQIAKIKAKAKVLKSKVVRNPFKATGLFLYLQRTSKNICFPDVFKGYRKRPML